MNWVSHSVSVLVFTSKGIQGEKSSLVYFTKVTISSEESVLFIISRIFCKLLFIYFFFWKKR